ncbi:MAG TPA: glutamate formimidoyltransferase [Acidobacteriaceae bacterium]|nr:glutamate formimidoyltransferase [Acidobacteriaceae bacterium]
MSDPLIECVPNFSEGREPEVVEAIVAAMAVDGVFLLDYSLDTDHHRSVVTIAGTPAAVMEAAVRGVGKAVERIDLTQQQGVHPRIGAADVIPFVPVRDISLEQCVLLARQAGAEIWSRYGVPVYFYEAAAARPDRVLLEDVRRGQFEGLREIVRRDVTRRPDIGGPELHPTAGATVVGARSFLIAWNLYLTTGDVATARSIAREIRASSGGLTGVKAMGVMAHGEAQISMNITDYRKTPISQVYAVVEEKAARFGVKVSRGELIGLIPEEAAERESDWLRHFHAFDPEVKILERRLKRPMRWPVAVGSRAT